MRRPGLVCSVMLLFLSACATSDPTQVSGSREDDYNERIAEINRSWEQFRVTGNECSLDDGACFADALETSGFEQAVSDLQATVSSLATDVEPGECASSLAAFDAKLEDLLDSLEALMDDAGATEANGLESSVLAVRSAWDTAVTEQGTTEACFSGGLEPTTER
jgi:hypothetical protein